MKNPYLLMWFEAPLQSWGYDSRFGKRETLQFPTKSGTIGLLFNALGYKGLQTEALKEYADLNIEVIAFPRYINGRAQVLPTLCDFQMVGSGYDDKDPWQVLMIPKTSEGKKAVGGGTKMTFRHYLQDMAFAVLLEMPVEKRDLVSQALCAPVYDLSLGRKCCAPTEFVFQGIYETKDEANQKAFVIGEEKERVATFRVIEGESEDGEPMTINDVPLQFGSDKRYRDRLVTVIPIEE